MENKIISFKSKFGSPTKFNSQFHMVKVYVAYAGKNRNYSIISKETFEKIIPSLYGVPVVGEWKGDDFGSHGGKIEISEDGVEYIDTTKPYGFIDSSATVQWEDVTEEDGTVNSYLTTTAFLWTERYPEALKVLENKSNQSMEINVFSGDMSEEHPDYFEIKDGEFSALCILGEEVEPAFESSRVSQFNLDKDVFKSEFTQMVAELKKSLQFTQSNIEGGESVKKDPTEKVVETAEIFVEDEVVVDELVADEPVEDIKTGKEIEDVVADTEEVVVDEEEKFTKSFELSHDDIRAKLYQLLYKVEDEDGEWYYIYNTYDDYFIYGNDYGEKHYKQGYIKTDVDVALEGERVELFVEFLTAEELAEVEKTRSAYELLEQEVVSLREFKVTVEQKEFEVEQEKLKQEKIDHINTEYEDISDDIKSLFISKVDEYEKTEDIDADICVYIVKNKVVFSKVANKPKNAKVNIEETSVNPVASPYGSLFVE